MSICCLLYIRKGEVNSRNTVQRHHKLNLVPKMYQILIRHLFKTEALPIVGSYASFYKQKGLLQFTQGSTVGELICSVAQGICSCFGHLMKSYYNHVQISPKSGPACARFNLAKGKPVSYVV